MTIEPCILLAVGHPVLRGLLAEQIGRAVAQGAVPAVGPDGRVAVATDAASALAALAEPVAAIVLDEAIEGGSAGPSLAARLRAGGFGGPILRIGDPPDAAPGAAAEIDGHLPRPVHLPTLLAMLAEGMARGRGGGAVRPFGRWRFDPVGCRLIDSAGERALRLTAKEAQILDRLLAAAGGAVSREALLGEVWGYAVGVATHTVETHMYRLRRKLETVAGEVPAIATVTGGWRLDSGAPER